MFTNSNFYYIVFNNTKMFKTIFLSYGMCIILFSFTPDLWAVASENDVEESESEAKTVVEVRAVLINCRSNEDQASPDTEAARFQREELFKHNALKDCNTKLAISIKLASSPKRDSDEYIPIDHVIEGPTKKRVRLLNPYVLRLRWDNPVQAYKLQNMDIVTGVFAESDKRAVEKTHTKYKRDRVIRSADQGMQGLSHGLGPSFFSASHVDDYVNSRQMAPPFTSESDIEMKKLTDFANYFNATSWLRKKRQQQNIIVETQSSDDDSWISDFDTTNMHERFRTTVAEGTNVPHKHDTRENNFWKKAKNNFDKYFLPSEKKSNKHHSHPKKIPTETAGNAFRDKESFKSSETSSIDSEQQHFRGTTSSQRSKSVMEDIYSPENTFSIYDIGNPDVWCVVHVQLFEKLITSEGKFVWNDITKGETASVSSLTPEWRDQDLNVQYRSTEWVPQEQFTLPVATNLCLLVPQTDDSDDSELLIVPTEDVVLMNDDGISLNKRQENGTQNLEAMIPRRKVMVRIARSFQRGIDNLNIVEQGSEHYLTLPYRRPHHIQIDVETRADDNQLIRVGAEGRITTAVSDNSRRTRTVFTVQATNTGLAAAKFRVKTRDCGPELSGLVQDRSGAGASTDFVLIPPHHTKRISLDLPIELPGEVAHCSVALVNQNDESVAIRDVTIKSGDRCYCVWHCDCVCLSEDPKLLCREMSEPRQAAAGLRRGRVRRTRALCYPDSRYLDVGVSVGGVLAFLLFLGFIKACLGQINQAIGTLYLDKMVELPRKLSHYHEGSLRDRRVEYDGDGWPVHPDTKRRSVRVLSRKMEFILNIIFFIAAPCLICWNVGKHLMSTTKSPKRNNNDDSKTHVNANFQEELPRLRLRRAKRLRKWMTPEADTLSTNLWRQGLLPQRSLNCKFMQPLLGEDDSARGTHSSSADSEQDDTEYVLTQMQKSRESLARTQMMNTNTSPSTK